MPSLWKKQKGNRISRLVADLQTTPKRGGSLVVETGFPTSLIDLFVKNKDKLKKPKSKKHKSKKVKTFSQNEGEDDVVVVDDDINGDDNDLPNLPSVSNSSDSLSDIELPICSIDQKNDAQIDEIHDFEKNVDVGNDDDSCNEKKRGIMGVSNPRNLVLFSVLMGVVVLILVLYTKRWFLAFVTLGFMLLLLLECVVNRNRNRKPVLKLFKPCENGISMSVLKGGLAVVVALYTKWFVVGITMGASLLILLEYAGNSGFGFRLFKPCQGTQWDLNGILSQLGAFKQRRRVDERDVRRRGRGVLTRSGLIGSRREVCKEVENDDDVSSGEIDQGEVGDEAMSRMEIVPRLGNDATPKMGTNLSFEDGNVIASKGLIKQCSTYVNDDSWLLEEDSRNKPMYEHIALESNKSKKLRKSDFSGSIELQGEKWGIEERDKGIEECKLVGHKGKNKKSKKFWKKLVPKKKNKKNKNKRGKENDGVQDAEVELEEEDEVEECEQEISDGEGSSTVSSCEDDEAGIDNFSGSYTEMLETYNRTTACGLIKARSGNSKYLCIMMIPLTGLIGGRLFAVVLTVICCLVFKIVRG